MITWKRHADIDKAAWDKGLEACEGTTWYALSSTLDAVSPGWDALEDEATGARMPLPWRSKYGVRYLFQPFLVQHLGPFPPHPSPQDAARFLQALPGGYRYADINLCGSAMPAMPGLRTEERTNHVLQLDRTAEALRTGYSTNHRRSLGKAAKQGVQVEAADSVAVIAFLEGSEQFRRWGINAVQRGAMRQLLRATEVDGTGFGRRVRRGGTTVAGAWFVRHGGRVIFLKGMGTAEGRELRAMHALIDNVVAEHAASGLVLDFAGGNDPQLARFYSGFGAEPVLYLRALMNRLPPLVRWLKP